MNTKTLELTSEEQEQGSFSKTIKGMINFAQLARLLGGLAIIISIISFLFNGWSEGNDIQRYLKLFSQTAMLTALGFIMSHVLKEYRGARVSFALSLLSVIANFTILGALLYSLFQLDGSLQQYPQAATWVAINTSIFWPLLIFTSAILAILTYFSFKIFSRDNVNVLSLSFLACNALLLIPVRSGIPVSALVIIGSAICFFTLRTLLKNEKTVFTNEAKFAIATLFIPVMVMIARAISFYAVQDIFLLTVSLTAYFAIRYCKPYMVNKRVTLIIMDIFQMSMAVLASCSIIQILPQLNLAEAGLFSFILTGFLCDVIFQSNDKKWCSILLNMTTFSLVTPNILISLNSYNIQPSLLCFVLCIALLFVNRSSIQNKFNTLYTGAGAIISLLLFIKHFIFVTHMSAWFLFSVVGVLLLVGASLYEKFGFNVAFKLKSNEDNIH